MVNFFKMTASPQLGTLSPPSKSNEPRCESRDFLSLIFRKEIANEEIRRFYKLNNGNEKERRGLRIKSKSLKFREELFVQIVAEEENGKLVALALVQLANLYADGLEVPHPSIQIQEVYETAAETGNPEAQYLLGKLYVDKDFSPNPHYFNKGLKWLKKLGRTPLIKLEDEPRFEMEYEDGSLGFLSEKWNMVVMEAQTALGFFFQDPSYERKKYFDLQKSLDWFKKASFSGSREAPFQLAMMYKEGLGVEKDAGKMMRYLKLGVKRGKHQALFSYLRFS